MREINNGGYIYIDADDSLKIVYRHYPRQKQRETVSDIFNYLEENHKMVDGYEGTPEYAEAIGAMSNDIEDELSSEPGMTKQEWQECLDEPDFVNVTDSFGGLKIWRFDEDILLAKEGK